MSSRLQPILAATRLRIEALHAGTAAADLRSRAQERGPGRDFVGALRRPGKHAPVTATSLRVIAELKRRSPSAGAIHEALDPVAAACELEKAGAAALSVLTEPDFFGGSLAILEAVRASVDLPLLRKDFILDPLQIVEARACGADAILLLAVALDDSTLRAFADEAQRWDLAVLFEAHDERELDRILALDPPVESSAIGVNARDLDTFAVDLERGIELAASIPIARVAVAESGVRTREHADRIAAACIDATLCGEGLMRPSTPALRFAELFGPRPDGGARPWSVA